MSVKLLSDISSSPSSSSSENDKEPKNEETPLLENSTDLEEDENKENAPVRSMSEINLNSIKPKVVDEQQKLKVKPIPLAVAVVVFLILYFIPIMKKEPAAHKCLAILIFVTIMWASEAIPLFVTSLFIPIPLVWFGVILDSDGKVEEPLTSSRLVAGKFFDPVVLLFLGGFTIAQALHKYELSERLAAFVLKKAGTNPKRILAYVMFLGWFLSCWISNVASTVVCTSVLLPIIRNSIPHGDNFQKAILIGNAFSNAIAGMNTLIASPQNAIALKVVQEVSKHKTSIGFLNWMGVAVPSSFLICVAIYFIILFMYPTKLKKIDLKITKLPKMDYRHYIILGTTIVTVLLMCVNSYIDKYVGDIGITALIPIVVFFGLGLLSNQDFGKLSWTVLLLIGGGLALGYGVQSSKLLRLIADGIGDGVEGQSIWVICLAFMVFAAVIGSLISSTVCAVIILPVIAAVGLKYNHLVLLTVLVTVMTSGSTSLPISSFPNSVSYAIQDHNGEQYLETKDFLKNGLPVSFVSLFVIMSVGFGICYGMGW
ncbi:low-affinity phosphate transporter pho91 [Anaeramoeba flamelloides]|uniref:Low-affinity phosphate transporter pho91 n=1 Tax=Anaeramoeba flamelloides TaxID=1746091 RepID=A0ABQ8Y4N7_9EUKA|nr:low-affinity phosphate transporter pho91 [Anaeramoeba flamelloides]